MSSIAAPAKTHIVIPARFKSTRLPGKPLLMIHGKPMILWVAEKAQAAHFADDMCIATDDERIAHVCIEAGFDVVMTSSEHASGTDRLAEVAAIKGWSDHDMWSICKVMSLWCRHYCWSRSRHFWWQTMRA